MHVYIHTHIHAHVQELRTAGAYTKRASEHTKEERHLEAAADYTRALMRPVCMHICVYVCMCGVCMQLTTHERLCDRYACMYVCMHACTCDCVGGYMCACMYAHT